MWRSWRNMQSAFRPHPAVLNHPSARVRRLALGTEQEVAALQRQAEAIEFDLPFEDADINGNHRAAPYRERHGLRSWREANLAAEPPPPRPDFAPAARAREAFAERAKAAARE